MWQCCLRPLSSIRCLRRTALTNVNQPTLDQLIERLSKSYRNQLEKQDDQLINERTRYLRLVLKSFDRRETILADLNETNQLSRGKEITDETRISFSFFLFD